MREVIIGGPYRHFKGNIYNVLAVARSVDTLEELVIYSDLKGNTWARSKVEFLSEVDKEAYPDATQEYRFELISMKCGAIVIDNEKIGKSYETNTGVK